MMMGCFKLKENRKTVNKGREAIKEIEEFIISAMEKMFSGRSKNIQNIQGLEEFLYIPTAVEEDEDENESLVGDIIGKRDDEGNALSTSISDVFILDKNDKIAIGKVMISNPLPNPHTKDKNLVIN